MRELKFRVWILTDKSMSPPVTLTDLLLTGVKHPQPSLHFIKSIQQGKSALMQYTGRKDKNGRDIYEGDIVKTKGLEEWDNDEHHIVSDVIWGDDSQWQVRSLKFKPEDDPMKHGLPLGWGGWKLEVIGNIYETPELLS